MGVDGLSTTTKVLEKVVSTPSLPGPGSPEVLIPRSVLAVDLRRRVWTSAHCVSSHRYFTGYTQRRSEAEPAPHRAGPVRGPASGTAAPPIPERRQPARSLPEQPGDPEPRRQARQEEPPADAGQQPTGYHGHDGGGERSREEADGDRRANPGPALPTGRGHCASSFGQLADFDHT
jgi:hypothetical protein